ncbi:hypothetical protein [Lysinibacillus sp. SGAir0095]|uniref:hypothetical protein n=1 Tax=Lysinibacillus sp. SGAir0095 TaxID=2070463 RepID=UPI00143CFFCB|nr:hypothetical protein [Lysinibacillus sp. SGAir0095]
MAGITLEQKIHAITRFENGDLSLTSIAKSLNLTTTEMLDFWIEGKGGNKVEEGQPKKAKNRILKENEKD